MTWYTFFKSVHVLAATVWVGGATVIQAYALRVLASRDGRRQAEFSKDTEFVGTRVIMPASAVLILTAIGLMINGNWSWGQNWVVLGLVVFGMSFVVGAVFLGPESGRIGRLIDAKGPDSAEVGARIRRILMVSRCELVLLVGVIWNMVAKPAGQGGWFWGSIAVMVAGVAAVIATHLRGATQISAPVTE